MNVMVCFRKGISSAITSSANTMLQHIELKTKSLKELGLNVEFVNLDKKNLSKTLEKNDIKPDYIYLYEDGKSNENDIREFIENNYPDINIISYNKGNSIYYDEYSPFHSKTYILDELILNNFNKSLKAEEKYIVNTNSLIQDLHVSKMNMTELDIQILIKNNNIHLFDTEKEADEFILKEIKENVCSIENDIEDLKKSLERKEAMLNKCKTTLEQKEQDFANKYKSNIKSKKNIERDI
jgi:hypothetical protein